MSTRSQTIAVKEKKPVEPSGRRMNIESWEEESREGYELRVSNIRRNFPDVEIIAEPYLTYEERDEHTYTRRPTQTLATKFHNGSIQVVVMAARLRKPAFNYRQTKLDF